MANTASIIFLIAMPLIVGILFFSFLARLRNVSLVSYWLSNFAAGLPWIIVIGLCLAISHLLPQSQQQAAVMVLLFPFFLGMICFGIAVIAGLFVTPTLATSVRIKWFALISGLPSFLFLLFILWVYWSGANQ